MEEIRRANRDCSAADLVFYFSENFPRNFTQGALLIAEYLAGYCTLQTRPNQRAAHYGANVKRFFIFKNYGMKLL